LKSTETVAVDEGENDAPDFSNFGSLKSTETHQQFPVPLTAAEFQQFRLVEEH